jgi:putative transposase
MGLTTAVTLANGEKIDAPMPLKAALARLKRRGQCVSRKVKGSNNRKKAVQWSARAHWRVAQIRKDWQHKTSTAIAKRFGTVCMENVNVNGMLANHCLARAISDIGWSELGRQLAYTCDVVQEVGRFFASSTLCSRCGTKTESMSLGVREWTCATCGEMHDRDVNAAKNIEAAGLRLRAASCAGMNACGCTATIRICA